MSKGTSCEELYPDLSEKNVENGSKIQFGS